MLLREITTLKTRKFWASKSLVQNFSRMAIFDIFASLKFIVNFLLRFKT